MAHGVAEVSHAASIAAFEDPYNAHKKLCILRATLDFRNIINSTYKLHTVESVSLKVLAISIPQAISGNAAMLIKAINSSKSK